MGMKLDMIAAGAYSVALERGMAEKDADAMVSGIIEKTAASRRYYREDDDDDEGDTWYDRNKGWFLPAVIGAGTLWAGYDAGRNGEADRSLPSNLFNVWGDRLGALFGVVNDNNWKRLTEVDKEWLEEQKKKYREGKL